MVINNTLHVPGWVREILNGWSGTTEDGDIAVRGGESTPYMDNAVQWREIRGVVHARGVIREFEHCIKINVMDSQVQPIYAVYGWLKYHTKGLR